MARFYRLTQREFKHVFRDHLHPYTEANLLKYWEAPSNKNSEWFNKPHRLLFDLIREVYHLRMEVNRLRKITGEKCVNPITESFFEKEEE